MNTSVQPHEGRDLLKGDKIPSLSVIIPTKNRPFDLQRALQSLFQQSIAPLELIVVDQSDSEKTHELVEEQYAAYAPSVSQVPKLRYIRDNTISGLAVARNRAMQMAEGDIWLFLDDDVTLEPDFLYEILAVYVRCPDAAGVGGVVTNYHLPSRVFRLWHWVFAHGHFHDERQRIYWRSDRLLHSEPIRVRKLGGGLMSFCAKAIQERFDDHLRGVSDGEDVDFCARLGSQATLLITPRARLTHNRSTAGRERGHWLRREVRSAYYLYCRNWNTSLKNWVCFAWLNVGYALVATLAGLRRISFEPWRALAAGAREGSNAALPPGK